MRSSLLQLAILALLLAVPACGSYEATTMVAYVPNEAASEVSPNACSFANRTEGACIARCREDDAKSCNDTGRLFELHATNADGLELASGYFERACELGEPRACKNAMRVAKRRAVMLRATPSASGETVSF